MDSHIGLWLLSMQNKHRQQKIKTRFSFEREFEIVSSGDNMNDHGQDHRLSLPQIPRPNVEAVSSFTV